MGSKSTKIKPASNIDSNVWYHVTEGRVDRGGKKFKSMLQVDNSTEHIKVFPVVTPPYYWQFQAVDKDNGTYVVRNSRDGASKQLSACRNETEPADGHTGVCMMPANGADDAQIWHLDQWGSSMTKDGLRFINAANGTDYWLDIHKGNPLFMTNNITLDGDDDKGEPSQHWYMTSAQAVNAIEYSTIQTIVPTSTEATTTTATTDPSATATSAGSSSSGGGLSTGAQAGIGVGVGLAVIALGIAALFLWRRRRNDTDAVGGSSRSPGPFTPGSANAALDTNKPLPPVDDKQHHQHYSELPDADANCGYHSVAYHIPQEMPTTTAPPPQEVPVQRFELDSTPVSR